VLPCETERYIHPQFLHVFGGILVHACIVTCTPIYGVLNCMHVLCLQAYHITARAAGYGIQIQSKASFNHNLIQCNIDGAQ